MFVSLLDVSLGAAVTNQVVGPFCRDLDAQRGVLLVANCQNPIGGTYVTEFIQSSADGGLTWYDVANFTFTTSNALVGYNLTGRTPITTKTNLTNLTIANNTSLDGALGDRLQVVWSSTGTYNAGTLTLSAVER